MCGDGLPGRADEVVVPPSDRRPGVKHGQPKIRQLDPRCDGPRDVHDVLGLHISGRTNQGCGAKPKNGTVSAIAYHIIIQHFGPTFLLFFCLRHRFQNQRTASLYQILI